MSLRVGLIYDTFDDYPWRPDDPPDADAEYEPEATVEVLERAVRALGHEPVRVGTAGDLLAVMHEVDLDAAVNIAESARTRNREAHVPVLLELADIPCLGSDALTLSLSLDKAWTKDLAATAGVPTPPYRAYHGPDVVEPGDLPAPFPLFVKPRYEGTSKGITAESRVEDVPALRERVAFVTETYRQDALVEAFVEGGGEFTVAVVGGEQVGDPPEALPVLQRAVEVETGIGLHALEHRGAPRGDWRYDLPGTLTSELETRIQTLAVRVFEKLECRDFARADFRVDADDRPWFLEINPLPTFAPDDTFAIAAEVMGLTYDDYLPELLGRGLRRLGLS